MACKRLVVKYSGPSSLTKDQTQAPLHRERGFLALTRLISPGSTEEGRKFGQGRVVPAWDQGE